MRTVAFDLVANIQCSGCKGYGRITSVSSKVVRNWNFKRQGIRLSFEEEFEQLLTDEGWIVDGKNWYCSNECRMEK